MECALSSIGGVVEAFGRGVFGVLGRVDGGIPRPLLAPSFILQTGLILPRHF